MDSVRERELEELVRYICAQDWNEKSRVKRRILNLIEAGQADERERWQKRADEIAVEVGGKFAETHRLNTSLNMFRAALRSGKTGEGQL